MLCAFCLARDGEARVIPNPESFRADLDQTFTRSNFGALLAAVLCSERYLNDQILVPKLRFGTFVRR